MWYLPYPLLTSVLQESKKQKIDRHTHTRRESFSVTRNDARNELTTFTCCYKMSNECNSIRAMERANQEEGEEVPWRNYTIPSLFWCYYCNNCSSASATATTDIDSEHFSFSFLFFFFFFFFSSLSRSFSTSSSLFPLYHCIKQYIRSCHFLLSLLKETRDHRKEWRGKSE